jgi:hypothetical protein
MFEDSPWTKDEYEVLDMYWALKYLGGALCSVKMKTCTSCIYVPELAFNNVNHVQCNCGCVHV